MRKILTSALVGAAMLGVAEAQAITFGFSGFTSDGTDPALLDASLNLSITSDGASSGFDLLTVTLDNYTAVPNAFTISEIYFNYTGDASLLNIESAGANTASISAISTNSANPPSGGPEYGPSADGFGRYDVKISLGSFLAPGTSTSWTIDMGVDGVSDGAGGDFDLWSVALDVGDPVAVAALFFQQGPCDPDIPDECIEDSGFGIPDESDGLFPPSSIPVPAAVWLFGSGLIGLAGMARRKKS